MPWQQKSSPSNNDQGTIGDSFSMAASMDRGSLN
jgi:hypothetical protein